MRTYTHSQFTSLFSALLCSGSSLPSAGMWNYILWVDYIIMVWWIANAIQADFFRCCRSLLCFCPTFYYCMFLYNAEAKDLSIASRISRSLRSDYSLHIVYLCNAMFFAFDFVLGRTWPSLIHSLLFYFFCSSLPSYSIASECCSDPTFDSFVQSAVFLCFLYFVTYSIEKHLECMQSVCMCYSNARRWRQKWPSNIELSIRRSPHRTAHPLNTE